MRRLLKCLPITVATALFFQSCFAQDDPNAALNQPDMVAWQLFLQVNADAKSNGNNNATFETWASDAETFTSAPKWPTTPSPLQLKPRALGLIQLIQVPGAFHPFVVPGGESTEETRRNKSDFDFIVQNKLFKVSGLQAAFKNGQPLSFRTDSIEVKANWVEVSALKGFNGFSGTAQEAAQRYHVNSAGGKQYAL